MAAALEVTVNKGSDAVYDYVCSVCEESNTLTEAKFNCERCYKFYCDGCVDLHNQLFKTHSVTGRENKNAWPVSKATKHIIEKCSAHKNEKLKMFCENHSELCCHLCILQGHRTCQSVVQIVEKSKEINTRGDVSLLIGEITRHIKDLDERTNTTEEMLKNLQDSYQIALEELKAIRKKIVDYLDDLEKKTIKELEQVLKILQESYMSDIDTCKKVKNDLQYLSGCIRDIAGKNEPLTYISYIKCLNKINAFKKGYPRSEKTNVLFKPNKQFEDLISKRPVFGTISSTNLKKELADANALLTVNNSSKHCVQLSSLYVSGITELPSGGLLMTDYSKQKVTLLDTNNKVTDSCALSNGPWAICTVGVDDVALTVGKSVQFLKVRNNRIEMGSVLQLQHSCVGIAHHDNMLYITSNHALYRYSREGVLQKKLYEDTSGGNAVFQCAVSPDGDTIYVTNYTHHKLLTLDKHGTLLASFSDPELQNSFGIYVTDAGHVIVSGYASHSILQISRDGKKKLATLLTHNDGMKNPTCVFVCKHNGSIIVGQDSDNILMFKCT
ncbi:uncharacterized protein LOC127881855 [Dreissena polymorpha]|uniref:uncharacterized protein LOC127881855 n=1 Tax=Dreissena polymorpha TaxID=45954 RepID=UPI002264A3EE|nr:uncharacterized protein LOC127881855 [Dreissena polymorpha]